MQVVQSNEKNEPEVYKSFNYRIETPDGNMFVAILEDEKEKPIRILLSVGKSGGALGAWVNVVAEQITEMLKTQPLERVIEMLSGNTSNRERRTQSYTCRSGPEGIVIALLRYKNMKYDALLKELKLDEYRPPRFHGR